MTSLVDVIPAIYQWKAQDIPEPEPSDGPPDAGGQPLTEGIIRDAMTRLLETIGEGFRMPPHVGSMGIDLDSEPGQIDQEIERIRSVMLAIKYDLGRRVALLCKRRNAMAPFNRLPPELLGLIFSHIIPHPPTSPHKSIASVQYNTLRSLSNVVRISTGWWNVVKLCPALWTTMTNEPNEDTALSLRHSGSLPLTIIHTRTYVRGPSPFIALVAAQSARWKFVHLEPDSGELDHIREPLRGSMPYLERLEIQSYEDHNDRTLLNLPMSSVLRCVSVLGVRLNPCTPALRSLKYLTLGRTDMVPITHILATLESTPLLESLAIRSFHNSLLKAEDEHVATHRRPPVRLPSLISLIIDDTPSPYAVALLDVIHTDSISSLHVETVEDGEDDGRVALRRLIQMHDHPVILAKVIAQLSAEFIKIRVDDGNELEIVGKRSDTEEGLPNQVNIRLFHDQWFDFLGTLENFSTFAASFPPLHLELASSTNTSTLEFLYEMPTVTIIGLAAHDDTCRELLQEVLGHCFLVDGEEVWACPELAEIRLEATEGNLETFMPAMLSALQDRQQASQEGKPPKITFTREAYNETKYVFEYVAVTWPPFVVTPDA